MTTLKRLLFGHNVLDDLTAPRFPVRLVLWALLIADCAWMVWVCW